MFCRVTKKLEVQNELRSSPFKIERYEFRISFIAKRYERSDYYIHTISRQRS